MPVLQLQTDVKFVKGVGPRVAEWLAQKNISTVEDLLYYLPFRYEDRLNPRGIAELKAGEMATVIAEVRNSAVFRTRSRNPSGLCPGTVQPGDDRPDAGELSRGLAGIRVAESDARQAAPKILGAALLRLTAEAYLLLDPQQGSPRQRWQALLALHDAAQFDAQQRGLEDVHAWLPPRVAKTFGRRIERLGWRRDDEWAPYCKRFYE